MVSVCNGLDTQPTCTKDLKDLAKLKQKIERELNKSLHNRTKCERKTFGESLEA